MSEDSKLGVMHVTGWFHPYQYTGRGHYMRNSMLPCLKDKGIRNFVLTSRYDDRAEAVESTAWGKIIRPRVTNKQFARLLFALKGSYYLFKYRKHYSVVHFHGLWDLFGIFSLTAAVLGKKTIQHPSLMGADDPLTLHRVYRLMGVRFQWLSRYDWYIAISSPIVKSFQTVGAISRTAQSMIGRVRYIPNGVRLQGDVGPAERAEVQKFKEQEGLHGYSKIAIFVGAVVERKGVDVLVAAWERVQREFADALLLIVGPTEFVDNVTGEPEHNPFYPQLLKAIESLKLNVIFKGERTEVRRFLACSDVFLFASRREGFGNAVVEAMASGLPIVISPMDGIAEDFVVGGRGGIIANGAEEFADACLRLFRNPELAASIGADAREICRSKFELQTVCDQYISLYRSAALA